MAKNIALTQAGRQRLEAELEQLKKVKRPAVIDRIKRAKDFGDLSENAEYEDARNEQSFIEGRVQEVEYILKYAKPVTNGKDHNAITLGSVVAVEMEGEKLDYEIVSSNEANPSEGRISNESPIGTTLIGAKTGETIQAKTPGGEIKIKVLEVK